MIVSNRGGSGNDRHAAAGGLQITPRFMLSETEDLSQSFNVTMRIRGPSTTTLTLTPAFRTHAGRDWYLLGGVEVPTTHPQPFDYQVLAAS